MRKLTVFGFASFFSSLLGHSHCQSPSSTLWDQLLLLLINKIPTATAFTQQTASYTWPSSTVTISIVKFAHKWTSLVRTANLKPIVISVVQSTLQYHSFGSRLSWRNSCLVGPVSGHFCFLVSLATWTALEIHYSSPFVKLQMTYINLRWQFATLTNVSHSGCIVSLTSDYTPHNHSHRPHLPWSPQGLKFHFFETGHKDHSNSADRGTLHGYEAPGKKRIALDRCRRLRKSQRSCGG